MDRDNPKFEFFYNADKLKVKDKTPIKQIFQNNNKPRVIVIKLN